MNESQRAEDRSCEAREATVERTSIGRMLAFGSVGLWLVTLVLLASQSGVHGF